MTHERVQRAYELFEAILQRPPEERRAYLEDACGSDAELLAEVQSLLAHDQMAGDEFMHATNRDARLRSAATQASPRVGPQSPDTASPPNLDGYVILGECGHGGMGVVYQARDMRLDRMVAIKTIQGKFQTDDRLRLIRREARLAAQLRHPNIVAVHSLIDTCDPPCVIMEWVDGVPIDSVARLFDFRETARLLQKVVRAVAYAHENGVVHRDLKPANILVDRAGEPRLLDFGLARAVLRPLDFSSGEGIKGTPQFMAPEQFLTPADVGPSADVYALGLVLFVMLTGTSPPVSRSPETVEQWAERELPLPRELDPRIPEALQRICLKACEIRPDDRYRSASQMADDLERFVEGRSVHARPTRYARMLEDRVQAHVDAVAEWEKLNLISRREADSLADRFFALLRTESYWVPGARRLRAGAVLLQAGGWLVVLSTILWPAFYWKELGRLERVFAIGVPTVLINAAAILLWRRFSQLVALIFTVVGTLLVPVFLLVLLSELRILTTRAADNGKFELLSADYFSNRQLTAAFWLSTIYSAWLLTRKRFTVLSATVCLMASLAVACSLLLAGMKDWLSNERYATVAVAFAGIPILAYYVARRLDRPDANHLAVPFYALAGVGLLTILGVLAYDAPKSWFSLASPDDRDKVNLLNVARELSFMGGGLLCFALAVGHDRAITRLRRLWGSLYFKVVPPCLVISLDLLGDEPLWTLGTVGNADVRLIEMTVPVLCVALVACGTRLQLRWYTYYGLIHLAFFVVRTTGRHFREYLSWPVIIVIAGALCMAVGLWLERRKTVQYGDRSADVFRGDRR